MNVYKHTGSVAISVSVERKFTALNLSCSEQFDGFMLV